MLCSTEMRSQKDLGPWGCALQGLRQRGNGKALPFQQKEQDRRSGQAGEGLPPSGMLLSPSCLHITQLHRRRRKCVTIHMFFCPEKFLFLAGF